MLGNCRPFRICFCLIWSKHTSPNSTCSLQKPGTKISSRPMILLELRTANRLSRYAHEETSAATELSRCGECIARKFACGIRPIMSSKMKAAQIGKAGGDFELVERDIPEPIAGQVRVKVEACGICHSDTLVKDGLWPGLQYPRVPGHEVAGHIDAIGSGVTDWKKGQRVGVGWHGGHDFVCQQCRRGDFAMCSNRKVTGIDFDGGYAEYVIAPAEALALIPDELPAEEAGPYMCAGVTVFNALRNSGARAGDLVAVQGIGGLGHLGVQYSSRMGFRTVAISGGKDKEALARKLGATHYIDAGSEDPGDELRKLGGAQVILATAP